MKFCAISQSTKLTYKDIGIKDKCLIKASFSQNVYVERSYLRDGPIPDNGWPGNFIKVIVNSDTPSIEYTATVSGIDGKNFIDHFFI